MWRMVTGSPRHQRGSVREEGTCRSTAHHQEQYTTKNNTPPPPPPPRLAHIGLTALSLSQRSPQVSDIQTGSEAVDSTEEKDGMVVNLKHACRVPEARNRPGRI